MDIPLDQILIQTINGVVTGMILALVASGLTLIFGIMDVVNFAHGELLMLGAYVGALMYVVTLRPLIGRDPLTTILATFGMSLVLQNYALWQFGAVSRKISEPIVGHFNLFHLDYPWYRVAVALLSAAIIGGFWLFLKRGTWGILSRATTQDRG